MHGLKKTLSLSEYAQFRNEIDFDNVEKIELIKDRFEYKVAVTLKSNIGVIPKDLNVNYKNNSFRNKRI